MKNRLAKFEICMGIDVILPFPFLARCPETLAHRIGMVFKSIVTFIGQSYFYQLCGFTLLQFTERLVLDGKKIWHSFISCQIYHVLQP